MVKYRIIYGSIFIGVLIAFLIKNNGIFLSLLLFLVALPCVLRIWLWRECRKLRLRIGVIEKPYANKPFPVRIEIRGANTASIGKIVGLFRTSHCISGEREEKSVEMTGPEDILSTKITMSIRDCGRMQLQMGSLRAYDCMGLTTYRMKNQIRTVVRVLPPEDSDLESSGSEKSFGDEFVGIRNYQEGDMMSTVHWKLSAKREQLVVRQYEEFDSSQEKKELPAKCQSCNFYNLCYN